MTDTNTAQMVADLTSTNAAVQGNGWVSPELGGAGGSLDLLGSMADPLSGLVSAGLGWFMPLVSFLGDGLSQLQGGDAASVSSGSQDFGNAGQDISNLAGSFGNSTTAQTTSWTGSAATDYRNTAAQSAQGVAGLGMASTTTGSSIIGAGQVVAQAISDITELIGEAVAQIVPIMTQAVARAQQTMGESVVEAIPPCVGIAVEYALKIASKLAALLASGQNLLKLVQGALGVVDLIQQALSSISQQSTQGGADPTAVTSSGGSGNALGATDSGPTAPMSADGSGADGSGDGSGGDGSGMDGSGDGSTSDGSAGSPDFGVSTDPSSLPSVDGSTALSGAAVSGADPLGGLTQSASVAQPLPSTVPAGAAGVAGGSLPMGTGGMGLAAGARSGADTVRQGSRQSPTYNPVAEEEKAGGVPLGGMGSPRTAGEKDKEHKRKYSLVEQHTDDVVRVAPPVIGGEE